MRYRVAAAVGFSVGYTSGETVRARMAELMEANARKLAERVAQDARRALRLAAQR